LFAVGYTRRLMNGFMPWQEPAVCDHYVVRPPKRLKPEESGYTWNPWWFHKQWPCLRCGKAAYKHDKRPQKVKTAWCNWLKKKKLDGIAEGKARKAKIKELHRISSAEYQKSLCYSNQKALLPPAPEAAPSLGYEDRLRQVKLIGARRVDEIAERR